MLTSAFFQLREMHNSRRHLIASLVILLVTFVPVWNSATQSSLMTNTHIAVGMLIFTLVMVPETAHGLRRAWREFLVFRIFCCMMLLQPVGWYVTDAEFLTRERTWFYAAQLLFFFAFVGWLSCVKNAATLAVSMKLINIIVISLIIISFFWLLPSALQVNDRYPVLPFYSHVRHYNYELIFAFFLIAWFIIRHHVKLTSSFLFFLLFSYISLWIIGRGQLLSTLIFIFLLMLTRDKKLIKLSITIILSFLAAILILAVTGQADILIDTLLASNHSNLNEASSGRLAIWHKALLQMGDDWLFGYGPDQLRFLQLLPSNTLKIVQAHNLLVQWTLEFGLWGCLALTLLFTPLLKNCLTATYHAASNSGKKDVTSAMLATFLIALMAYNLVDGVFYHGIPTTMSLMVMGIFYHRLHYKRHQLT